jgi:hypothetical protein
MSQRFVFECTTKFASRPSWRALQVLALLVLGLLAAQGARAQKITMEFDQTIDFSKYKTFAIRDGRLNSANPALNSDLVKKQIEADIQNHLTAKGLTMVTSGPSDLNVRYTFGSARKTEIEAYPAGWYGAPSPPRTRATPASCKAKSTPWSKSPSTNIPRRSSRSRVALVDLFQRNIGRRGSEGIDHPHAIQILARLQILCQKITAVQ